MITFIHPWNFLKESGFEIVNTLFIIYHQYCFWTNIYKCIDFANGNFADSKKVIYGVNYRKTVQRYIQHELSS